MSDGTTVKLYMPRVHKHNAEYVLSESQDTAEYITRTLVAMASSAGEPVESETWYEHCVREVPSLLEEYGELVMKQRVANEIIAYPDDCEDDLEPQKASEATG